MGLSVTNAAAVIGDAATLLPIDAIQEFNTQVNPKAEFGWKPGAITSVGLKSGTNSLHGSAYAFGRSDSFDARNYFDPVGTPKTPVELEQYGGSLGGRIIPDKLFYFGAYEGQKYTVGNSGPGGASHPGESAEPVFAGLLHPEQRSRNIRRAELAEREQLQERTGENRLSLKRQEHHRRVVFLRK